MVRLSQIAHATESNPTAASLVDARTIVTLSGFAPPTLHAMGIRVATSFPSLSKRPFNLLITNAPGAQSQMYIAGTKLLETYAVPPLLHNQALAIGVTSYNGDAVFRNQRRPRSDERCRPAAGPAEPIARRTARGVPVLVGGENRCVGLSFVAVSTATSDGAPKSEEVGIPGRAKISDDVYEAELFRLQTEFVKLQEWVRAFRGAHRGDLRGPRRRGQGRHHQTDHRIPQPARRTHRRAARADRSGTRAVVLPALHRPPARQGRDRAVRPVLVQPGRRREGHGILYAARACAVPAADADLRADADRRRDPAAQVLVLGLRRRAAAPVQSAAATTRSGNGSSARWTWSRCTGGRTIRGPRTR